MSLRQKFINRPQRILPIFVLGFSAFFGVMALLESNDLPRQAILWLFITVTLVTFAAIGILFRSHKLPEYYNAGRSMSAVYNGMATGASWMSGASFIALVGVLYSSGYDGLSLVIGWVGGCLLIAVLLAPYLRKSGAYTVPEFIELRYGGSKPALTGSLIVILSSFVYLVAQIYSAGIITSYLLGTDFAIAASFAFAGIVTCSTIGGMRSVSWAQVTQYALMLSACLVPVIWIYGAQAGSTIPLTGYGSTLGDIAAMEQTLELYQLHNAPFAYLSPVDFYALIFCFTIGTTSLPHVLTRSFTSVNIRTARNSIAWSTLFVALILLVAPVFAVFAKFKLLSLFASNPDTILPFSDIPQWVYHWAQAGGEKLISICGVAATDMASVQSACEMTGRPDGFYFTDLLLNRDIILFVTSEMLSGMPYTVLGLVAAGAISAMFASSQGLMLTIASSFSHDIYGKMIDPMASEKSKLLTSHIVMILIALLAAFISMQPPADILTMVAWAFSLAGAGLFSALVLGVWWNRTTDEGAIAGMLTGVILTLFYILGNVYGLDFIQDTGDEISWFGINSASAGIFGIPLAFVTTIIVSLITAAPDNERQYAISKLRLTRGRELLTHKQDHHELS